MSETTRRGRLGSLQKFVDEYRRSRLGVAGAIIIFFFVLIALLAPVLATHNPIKDQHLASPFSIPIWARAFPQYSDYPVNSQLLLGSALNNQSALSSWSIAVAPASNSQSPAAVTYSPTSS